MSTRLRSSAGFFKSFGPRSLQIGTAECRAHFPVFLLAPEILAARVTLRVTF